MFFVILLLASVNGMVVSPKGSYESGMQINGSAILISLNRLNGRTWCLIIGRAVLLWKMADVNIFLPLSITG